MSTMDEEVIHVPYFGCGNIIDQIIWFRHLINSNGKDVAFSDHESNIATIKQLLQWYKDYNQLPEYDLQNKKDNKEAEALRHFGNNQFKNKNLPRALELYNESICWADHTKGVDLAIAFAKRSAVYFEWEQYDICLENINLALKLGHPERYLEKLNARKVLCIEYLKNGKPKRTIDEEEFQLKNPSITDYSFDVDNSRDIPKLSLNSHPNIPFIVDSLEVMSNPEEGFHIITKNDLNPGQIIAIEEPYASALSNGSRYRNCANCFEENYMNLIPCKMCTCAMFCSEKCLNEAQNIHKFECPIMEFIWRECKEFALPLRLVIKAFATFDSVDELIQFRRENKNRIVNVTGNDKERYSHVSNLLTHEIERDDYNLFLTSCKVAILYYCLIEKTEFSQILKTEIHRDTLISVILENALISLNNSINCHNIRNFCEEDTLQNEYKNVSTSGIYPFCSLFNHSCAPNTATVAFGTKVVTYVTRPIKSNSQVYGCYKRINHIAYSKSHRGIYLSLLFCFRCKCEACDNDYMKYNFTQQKSKLTETEMDLAHKNNKNLNMYDIDEFCSILRRHAEQYPCYNLYPIVLKLQRAMRLKYGNIPCEVEIALRYNNSALAEKKKFPNSTISFSF